MSSLIGKPWYMFIGICPIRTFVLSFAQWYRTFVLPGDDAMLTYNNTPESLIVKEADNGHYQPNPPKLLDQVRIVLRRQHYAIRTEETYVQWIIRFIHFHNMRHPQDMDTPDIEAFLNHLAVKQQISASTQNQAFSAILFLYKHVLYHLKNPG